MKELLGRITIICNSSSGRSGADRSTLDVAEEMHRRHIRIQLVHAHPGDLFDRWQTICDDIIQVPSTLFSRRHFATCARAFHMSRRRVALFRPDRVYTHSVSQLPLALGYRRKVALHIHNDPEGPSRAHDFLLNRVHHVFFVSRGMCDAWSDVHRIGVPMSLAYNGVHVPAQPLGSDERQRTRAHLGVPPGLPVVGFLGRDSPEKRLDLLLEALFEPKRPDHWPVPVALVIGGELAARSEAKLRSNPSWPVVAIGYSNDPWALMSSIDVLAIPSDREGLARVALEALALGIPVAATAVGGLPEILGGFPELLARPGDAVDVRRAIDNAISHPPPSEQLREVARGFSWESTVDGMLADLAA